MDGSNFDPYNQNITITRIDGTKVHVPVPLIDRWNDETASICINYGSQLGASIAMLAVVLIMTPSSKLARPSNVLNILGLVICIIRMVLLSIYFLSPFSHFYQVWGEDWDNIPLSAFQNSIAGTTFSFLLVVVVEMALMNQAWAMVVLWSRLPKYIISALSGIIMLMAIGWRLAFSIIQCESILGTISTEPYGWLAQAMLISNAISICWFCAVFNLKLILHLVSNRGVLPSRRALSPMEVLVMANGILMVVPVIFAGLEWGHFTNFEAGSVAHTAVVIILPLGTLAAQRVAQTQQISYPSASSGATGPLMYNNSYKNSAAGSSSAPLRGSPFSTATNTTLMPAMLSRYDEGTNNTRDRIDPVDLELMQIDGYFEPREAHTKADSTTDQLHR